MNIWGLGVAVSTSVITIILRWSIIVTLPLRRMSGVWELVFLTWAVRYHGSCTTSVLTIELGKFNCYAAARMYIRGLGARTTTAGADRKWGTMKYFIGLPVCHPLWYLIQGGINKGGSIQGEGDLYKERGIPSIL